MKYAFFPYTKDVETLCRFRGFRNVQICGVMSYPENEGRIRGELRKGSADELLQDAQALVILEKTGDCDPQTVADLRCKAEEMGIPVFLKEENRRQGSEETLLCKELDTETYRGRGSFEKHYTIRIPVILIVSAGCDCGKFDTHLQIESFFEKTGYKITGISSNALGALYGMYTIPGFLKSKELSYAEKVRMLNWYIWKICRKEDPDVLALTVPGGVFTKEDDPEETYGEYLEIFSKAVSADAVILNVYNDARIRTQEEADSIASYLDQRFGFPLCMIRRTDMITRKNEETGYYEYYRLGRYAVRENNGVLIEDEAALDEALSELVCAMQDGASEV